MAETTRTTKPTLSKDIAGVEVTNHELLKLAYDIYLAQARLASATTKQRGEVRGGGKKPWKQKGTGQARVGSNRSPLWSGGGITFRPNKIGAAGQCLTAQVGHRGDHVTLPREIVPHGVAQREVVLDEQQTHSVTSGCFIFTSSSVARL